jgi:NhaP-type Na+/H+ or K+/H+ antiporter
LELGARLEKRAAVHARFSHVIGRAVLLTMIYISACRAARSARRCGGSRARARCHAVALELFPRAMRPGGELWALLLVWVCSYHAGDLFERVGAPKALGMLVAGLVLRSLPPAQDNAAALDQLVNWWSRDFRAAAMALVLLRAGLGMDISSVMAYGWSLPVMATLPSLAESVIGAAFASYLFSMPFLLAWVMSFMVSAVGPAIIASGCAAVKEKGYVNKAPNFLMTTAVFDDTTCIIGFNCLLHAWIPGEGNVGWQYAIGPMNLVLGVFGGVVAALALSATALYPGTGPRTWTLFAVCMCLIFVAETHELLGAGAIANLVFGLGVRNLWKRGWPARFLAPEHAHDPAAASAEMLLSSMAGLYKVWNIVFYPLLFGLAPVWMRARRTPASAVWPSHTPSSPAASVSWRRWA